METYRHTQKGTVIRVALGAGFTTVLGVQVVEGWNTTAILVMAILGFCLLIFSKLTVIVGDGLVSCHFGPVGLIRKKIWLSDIQEFRAVRNSWLSGWGIRWQGRGSSMWNVSGFDAVELSLKSNRRFRIGTDEPDKLIRALQDALRCNNESN